MSSPPRESWASRFGFIMSTAGFAVRIFDMDLFVLLDTVSGTFLLPTAALATSLYVVFVWTFQRFRDGMNVGSSSVKINAAWKPLVVFVIPVAVIVVLLMGLGVL